MAEPRILLFDLENAPNVSLTWGKYKQDVRVFIDSWYILCIAWRWMGEKKTQVFGIDDTFLAPQQGYVSGDDYGVVEKVWELFDEADVLVAHNGDAFDIPKANQRMLVHGFEPPSPSQSFDTLKVARSVFSFGHNLGANLDDICMALDIGKKQVTGGFGLWESCMAGDLAAWKKMKRYCKSDVDLLVSVYEHLRPWAPRHPNLATIGDRPSSCPRCGSEAGMVSRGKRFNAVTYRNRYQCKGCGGYVQGRKILRSDSKYVV